MKRRVILAIVALMMTLLFGCSVANYVVDPYARLNFNVADNVNPDLDGRASPVIVKIYELSSPTLFENQDFFGLYDEAEKVLGADLILGKEYELAPGGAFEYQVSLAPGVRHVGILVAYRDIDNASWREVIDVEPTKYKNYTIDVGRLAVYVQ